MTDREGCFRERVFREWLASKNVRWDPQLRQRGALESCEALFDDCTEAHNELHRRRGYSPFQLLIGRLPPGLPLDGDKQLGEVSASLTSDGRHRLHTQRVFVVEGDQLVRCSSAHLRPVSTAEQTLCSLRDGEARTFQQVVRELPKRNFVDLVGQPSPIEEDFEEPMDVSRDRPDRT